MAYIRLQGMAWHNTKHKLKISEIFIAGDSVRLNCYDPKTRKYYSHVLSDRELKIYEELMENLENILFEKDQIAFSE